MGKEGSGSKDSIFGEFHEVQSQANQTEGDL
jgi:hypothetical protein